MTYFLDLRAEGVGGSVATAVTATLDGTIIDSAEIITAARGRAVVFVTHGFNVDRADGINCLSLFEPLMALQGTLYVGVLWPGDSRWAPVIDYPFEGDEAIASGNLLSNFINENFSATTDISFASHSLGVRVVLQTALNLNRRVRRIVLMAAAIDDDCLVNEYAKAADNVDEISVLASTQDEVLELAFPAGNFLSGLITRGDPYWHSALGRHGPETPLPSNLHSLWELPDAWGFGHGSYLPSAAPAGGPIPLPTDLPPNGAQPNPTFTGWQTVWAASFTSTRLL